ncbi:alpha-hydroxy acid oxidase [Streptomyces sp. NPDC001279]|uniref:alpha-hydroxy acid oxidase n=1 Tax=Streptomyces sp. NPDC001279 TaxID=3364556 RepID=UPI00369FA9E8
MTLRATSSVVCIGDLERIASAVLPLSVWDFVSGGSGNEVTLAANRAALERIQLVPRVLTDVSQCSTATTLLGEEASMPVATAPIGYQKLVHPDGELAGARAAMEAGIPFTVGTLSSYPVERIAGMGGVTWFQLYWLRDRVMSYELVRRAEDAGCAALMLTVDVPWMGRRLRDMRNAFVLPDDVEAANFSVGPVSAAHRAIAGGSALAAHTSMTFASSLNWSDLEELRGRTKLPLIVKGLLDPADAARAAECGADAVVVSNHGGRQLDGAVPGIDVLEAVCAAVSGRCEVLVDGGIRSGVDVLKALALGANGVLLGRPLLWGLAAGGTDGARELLRLLAAELRDALGLAGCANVSEAQWLRTTRGPLRTGESMGNDKWI